MGAVVEATEAITTTVKTIYGVWSPLELGRWTGNLDEIAGQPGGHGGEAPHGPAGDIGGHERSAGGGPGTRPPRGAEDTSDLATIGSSNTHEALPSGFRELDGGFPVMVSHGEGARGPGAGRKLETRGFLGIIRLIMCS
jgi:hypothetical protein